MGHIKDGEDIDDIYYFHPLIISSLIFKNMATNVESLNDLLFRIVKNGDMQSFLKLTEMAIVCCLYSLWMGVVEMLNTILTLGKC